MHVDASASVARLTVIHVDAPCTPIDSLLDISVGEDDVGTLAAKFKCNLLQVGISCSTKDSTASDSRSCECHLIDIHVLCNCSANGLAVARDEVDSTGGKTSLFDQTADV